MDEDARQSSVARKKTLRIVAIGLLVILGLSLQVAFGVFIAGHMQYKWAMLAWTGYIVGMVSFWLVVFVIDRRLNIWTLEDGK